MKSRGETTGCRPTVSDGVSSRFVAGESTAVVHRVNGGDGRKKRTSDHSGPVTVRDFNGITDGYGGGRDSWSSVGREMRRIETLVARRDPFAVASGVVGNSHGVPPSSRRQLHVSSSPRATRFSVQDRHRRASLVDTAERARSVPLLLDAATKQQDKLPKL